MAKTKAEYLFAREAEQSIVAALFSGQGSEAFDRLSLVLRPEHFYFASHKIAYVAFGDLVARGIRPDATELATHIKSSSGYDESTRKVIAEAISNPFSLENIERYADAVVEKARARQMVELLDGIQNKASLVGGELSSKDLLREIDAVSMNFEQGAQENQLLETSSDALRKVIERLEELQNGTLVGVPTGIALLDEKLGGMMPGNLVIGAGRPGMGKSAFALNVAVHHSILGVEDGRLSPVTAVFSMEMETEELGFRFLSNIGSVDHDRLRKSQLTDSDWSRLALALDKYEKSSIKIDCSPSLSPSILRGKLRLLKRQLGDRAIGLVIIDYLQLMEVDKNTGANRNEQITEISRNLKRIAKEFGVPIMALSQLNRDLEKRADKRPVLSDLRESGAIEQDADTIIFFYRDEYYNPDSSAVGIAEIIIGKARHGKTGMAPCQFIGEYQRFSDIASGSCSYDSKYGEKK